MFDEYALQFHDQDDKQPAPLSPEVEAAIEAIVRKYGPAHGHPASERICAECQALADAISRTGGRQS